MAHVTYCFGGAIFLHTSFIVLFEIASPLRLWADCFLVPARASLELMGVVFSILALALPFQAAVKIYSKLSMILYYERRLLDVISV